MEKIRQRKTNCAKMLAVTMLFSVISPTTATAQQCDPVQESAQTESTTERGEYVIALEENMTALVSDPGEASKITKGTDTVIYETDLSKRQYDSSGSWNKQWLGKCSIEIRKSV